MIVAPITREVLHFHLFAGLGGGAKGFNGARVQLGPVQARFRCLGGIDNDPAAVRDFGRLAGVHGTCMDLFDREQFEAFHGRAPGSDWREATPDDIRQAAGGERPHIVFLSAPCKGFSGLLSETRSLNARYQALNRLTLRGVWLMLEAWAGDPPELVVFENVPRIATRGRALLDQIVALLRSYGYATAETTHDCGKLGGLAQSRKRFLLVARHQAKVPPFLYEPPQRRLRGVGEVLDRLPLPGDLAAGPMHRVPALQWRTWVRLAFVEAGSDWRSLNKLRVQDGMLQDFAIAPEVDLHRSALGVRAWTDPSGVVTSRGHPYNGAFSVADPRAMAKWHDGSLGVHDWTDTTGTIAGATLPGNGAYSVADPRRDIGRAEFGQYGVKGWDETSQAVTSKAAAGSGRFTVADPRHHGPAKHCNEFRIVPWVGQSGAVTGAHGTGQCVADPRHPDGAHKSKYRVTGMAEPAGAVIAGSTTVTGAFAVADPRTPCTKQDGEPWAGGGQYGVVPWDRAAHAVTGSAGPDSGRWSVADPRVDLPLPDARLVCRIRALDGTWHRPFTTLELAALQSLVDPEEMLELDGLSDAAWRERIGNAVPAAAAQAIAETMGCTLLLAWAGEGFALSNVPIWVRPVAVALSVAGQGADA